MICFSSEYHQNRFFFVQQHVYQHCFNLDIYLFVHSSTLCGSIREVTLTANQDVSALNERYQWITDAGLESPPKTAAAAPTMAVPISPAALTVVVAAQEIRSFVLTLAPSKY